VSIALHERPAPINTIKPGRYRHDKGNDDTVLGVARHSETFEELVAHGAEYGERGLPSLTV